MNMNSCGCPLIFESTPTEAMGIGVDGGAPWWSWGSLLELFEGQLVLIPAGISHGPFQGCPLAVDVPVEQEVQGCRQQSHQPMSDEFPLLSQSFISLKATI